MPLNVNGALRLIYHVRKLVHLIIKCFTIKHLCIFRLEFTNSLTLDKIEAFEKRYTQILDDGFKEDYIANNEAYYKKKVKKSTSLNLLNRLSAYKNEMLSFMYDFDMPFDNNLAGRDLQMTKVKQKISRTFRSLEGANSFARIRGYVSTVRKNKLNTLDSIKSTFTLVPVDPTLV